MMVVARTVVSWHILSAENVVSEGKAIPQITSFWHYNRIDRAPVLLVGDTDLYTVSARDTVESRWL